MESFELLKYPNVKFECSGGLINGNLILTDTELSFKPLKPKTKKEIVLKEDIDVVNWQRFAGSWGLRIFTNAGQLFRFAGFKDTEREKLAKFFHQAYDKDFLVRELSLEGWNWGTAKFNGDSLSFVVNKSEAFEIPLPAVKQCTTGKNEVALHFDGNEESTVSLSGITFHIPSSTEVAECDDPVQVFKEQVMKKASGLASTGEALAI